MGFSPTAVTESGIVPFPVSHNIAKKKGIAGGQIVEKQ